MRDPELVARAQRAAAHLESAWERWRSLQGLGETPAQPVVGYVGYALKEPWGQPRAVIGFSAEEAERLAEFLEDGNSDHGALQQGAADRGVTDVTDQKSADQGPEPAPPGLELAQQQVPEQAAEALIEAPAMEAGDLAVTSQLPGSQLDHSFLPGSGARLEEQEPVSKWLLS